MEAMAGRMKAELLMFKLRKTLAQFSHQLLTESAVKANSGQYRVIVGHPKLFMSCPRAYGKLAPQVVNKFDANRAATLSEWPLVFIFCND
jgi:hypothetical protein